MTKRLTGTCLCQAVRYEVDDEFEYALICHCSQCRRATGSAFKPFAGIRVEALSLVGGDAALWALCRTSRPFVRRPTFS